MPEFQLDEQSLERIVRSEVGPGIQIERVTTVQNSPLGMVVELAEGAIGHPVAIFLTVGGIPQNFSLPLLNPAVIVCSIRYMQFIVYLRGILKEDLHGVPVGELAERATRRITAELALGNGDPALACYLVARSAVGSLDIRLPTIAELEMWPIDETYMTFWFHALLHELGHVEAEKAGVEPSVPGVRGYIEGLIEDSVSAVYGEDRKEEILETIRSTRGHSLDPGVLMRELGSDRFLVRVLFGATASILKAGSRLEEFSDAALCAEILDMFVLHTTMNGLIGAAQGSADSSVAADHWSSVAMRVRINIIFDFLVYYLSAVRGEDGKPEPAVMESIRSQLADWVNSQERQARINLFNKVQVRIVEECILPARRELGTFERLAEEMEEPSGMSARAEIKEFCTRARAVGVQHPDIDLLETMWTESSKATEVLQDACRAFRVLENKGQPLVLIPPGSIVPLILVFRTAELTLEYLQKFQALIDRLLQVRTIESATENDVAVILNQAAARHLEQSRIHAVFEGSTLFRQLVSQLDDPAIGIGFLSS